MIFYSIEIYYIYLQIVFIYKFVFAYKCIYIQISV
jgi:hypothetical protein